MKELLTYQWNTGNGYTKHGQRIGAIQLPDGLIVFADIDRGIDGVIPKDFRPEDALRQRVEYGYMHTECEYWNFTKHIDYLAFNLVREAARGAAHKAQSHCKE